MLYSSPGATEWLPISSLTDVVTPLLKTGQSVQFQNPKPFVILLFLAAFVVLFFLVYEASDRFTKETPRDESQVAKSASVGRMVGGFFGPKRIYYDQRVECIRARLEVELFYAPLLDKAYSDLARNRILERGAYKETDTERSKRIVDALVAEKSAALKVIEEVRQRSEKMFAQ